MAGQQALAPTMISRPRLPVFELFGFGLTPGTLLPVCLVLVLNLICISPGQAVIEMDQLSNPELSARYRQLIEEYRCPKCQNQNLAGSDSPISADLRREIRRMLEEGDSDEQISDYLVARYGDFVLYRPRLTQGTYLLWWGPGLLLLIGLSVAAIVISRQRAKARELSFPGRDGLNPDSISSDSLSPTEQQALDDLLAESGLNSEGGVATDVDPGPRPDNDMDKPTS